MVQEITFIGKCEICGKKEAQCSNHHLVPRRLLNILPKQKIKQYEFWKVIVCTTCNKYFHPENKLYERITLLEDVIKLLDGYAGSLRRGRYPDASHTSKLVAVLRGVADQIDV
jgi:hypothetical protein